jgi:hypothetical protein
MKVLVVDIGGTNVKILATIFGCGGVTHDYPCW